MFLTKDNKIKWKLMAVGSALALLFVGLGVFWFDKSVFLLMRNFNTPIWRGFEIVFSFAAWLALSALVFAVAFIVDKFKLKSKLTNVALYVFGAVVGAGGVAAILRVVLGRMRPVFFLALDKTGFYPGNFEWAFNSMPSGHATASFAALVMIGLFFPKWKWATWTLAIIIGISRICIGAHWPSDVLLGALIGMIAADLVKHYLPRILGKIKIKK